MVENVGMNEDVRWGVGSTGEEEDDDERVDDGEPMDLDVAHGQVRVPA